MLNAMQEWQEKSDGPIGSWIRKNVHHAAKSRSLTLEDVLARANSATGENANTKAATEALKNMGIRGVRASRGGVRSTWLDGWTMEGVTSKQAAMEEELNEEELNEEEWLE